MNDTQVAVELYEKFGQNEGPIGDVARRLRHFDETKHRYQENVGKTPTSRNVWQFSKQYLELNDPQARQFESFVRDHGLTQAHLSHLRGEDEIPAPATRPVYTVEHIQERLNALSSQIEHHRSEHDRLVKDMEILEEARDSLTRASRLLDKAHASGAMGLTADEREV